MILGQLLEKVLPIVLEGKATGGGTSTIVDSGLIGKYDDDSFKDALAFLHSTTDGLAPVNQFSVVNAYADSTGTFTVDTVYSAAVGAGDYYALADPQFKKAAVLRVVNDALRDFGIVSLLDESVSTSGSTLEYDLPIKLKAWHLDKVEIGNATDGWTDVENYRVTPATDPALGKIVFSTYPGTDTLRLWYRDYHWAVDTYDDYISNTIPDARVIRECKVALHRYVMDRDSDMSQEALQKLGLLQQERAEAKNENRINVPSRKISKFLSIRDI